MAASGFYGAVELNNIAVHLLQHRNYRRAAETMRDAISTLKWTLRPSDNPVVSSAGLEEQIQNALRHLGSTETHALLNNRAKIVVCNGNTLFMAIKSALPNGIQQPALRCVPLFIEKANFNDARTRDFDIESAIMLSNFAIAQLFMSDMSQTIQDKLRENAVNLFEKALSIILPEQDMFEMKIQDIHVCGEIRLLLAVAILESLAKSHFVAGRKADASVSCRKLVFLKSVLLEWDVCGDNYCERAAACAA